MPDKAKPNDPAQSQRFIDMANEVDVDEMPGAFDNLFLKTSRLKARKLEDNDKKTEE